VIVSSIYPRELFLVLGEQRNKTVKVKANTYYRLFVPVSQEYILESIIGHCSISVQSQLDDLYLIAIERELKRLTKYRFMK
jgi:hypothetical protein